MVNYAKFKRNDKNLYTVDLICHGTPSPMFLDMFLSQYGVLAKIVIILVLELKIHFKSMITQEHFLLWEYVTVI